LLRDLWNRMRGRHLEHLAEEHAMSADERRYAERAPEDKQADWASIEHLGGGDPDLHVEHPPDRPLDD
jgi:hypothetical protein